MKLVLSIRSKPFAVRMFAEGLTWQLFTPFALRRLKSRHQKYKSRHPKIDKNQQASINIANSTRYMLQQSPGACFSEGAEAPQAAATQTQRAGDPETDNYCRLSRVNLDN